MSAEEQEFNPAHTQIYAIAAMDLITAQRSLLAQSVGLDELRRKMLTVGLALTGPPILNPSRFTDAEVQRIVSDYIVLLNNFSATIDRIEELEGQEAGEL